MALDVTFFFIQKVFFQIYVVPAPLSKRYYKFSGRTENHSEILEFQGRVKIRIFPYCPINHNDSGNYFLFIRIEAIQVRRTNREFLKDFEFHGRMI